jgi:prepilin-type N-terminal cleavage/methylation domain-containing protein
MSISIHKKGFTLVELLIVLSIIGVLVAGLYPKITGYLARGRDSTKITEIAQINTALVLFQVANKTYLVPGTGNGWTWEWWINYTNGGTYLKSLFTGLQEKWFINKSLNDHPTGSWNTPAILSNTAPCVTSPTTTASQNLYMLYFNDSTGKYSISGYLENQLKKNIDNMLLSYNSWTSCGTYGMNYAVGIN